MTRGRMSKYTKKSFREKVYEYIDYRTGQKRDPEGCVKPGPITIIDFCIFAKVARSYIEAHDLKDKSKNDFSDTIEWLRMYAEHNMLYGGLLNKLNPNMAKFCLQNNHGYKNTNSNEITGPSGGSVIPGLNIEIVSPNSSDNEKNTKD